MRRAVVATPLGPFTVVADGDDVVLSGWTTEAALDVPEVRDLGPATDAVRAYFEGDVAAIDAVPVRQRSGPFVEHAWTVLRQVEPGRAITYTELARRAGRPAAARAAAMACGRNAAALFVPCHRIIGTDGRLRGFRWGVEVKQWLLDHEARVRS
jgi:methylated-DNA-[protein]-cysteine S-methyltransferase